MSTSNDFFFQTREIKMKSSNFLNYFWFSLFDFCFFAFCFLLFAFLAGNLKGQELKDPGACLSTLGFYTGIILKNYCSCFLIIKIFFSIDNYDFSFACSFTDYFTNLFNYLFTYWVTYLLTDLTTCIFSHFFSNIIIILIPGVNPFTVFIKEM